MFDKEKVVGAAVAMMDELEKFALPQKTWEAVEECLRCLGALLPSPVEDSKWNAKTMQEAKQLVEVLTEHQWKTICEVIPPLAKFSTPEQKQEAQERKKQAEAQQEALKADFELKRCAAAAFREKKHKGVTIPTRYDISIEEIEPLLAYTFHPLSMHEGIYDIVSTLFVMGFKRGMAYQKAKSKKKGN